MGRTLKRVPLDFDWKQGKVWEGYINPHYKKCPDCSNGYTPAHRWLDAITQLIMIAGEASQETRPLHPWLQSLALAPRERPDAQMAALSGGLAGRPPRAPLGHDSVDEWEATKKIVQAAGLDPATWGICQTCKGSGVDPAKQETYEAWERTEPPTGEGYQLWETTTEGSPDSPVFASLDELCAWCEVNATTFADYRVTAEEWKKMLADGMVYCQQGNIIVM